MTFFFHCGPVWPLSADLVLCRFFIVSSSFTQTIVLLEEWFNWEFYDLRTKGFRHPFQFHLVSFLRFLRSSFSLRSVLLFALLQ